MMNKEKIIVAIVVIIVIVLILWIVMLIARRNNQQLPPNGNPPNGNNPTPCTAPVPGTPTITSLTAPGPKVANVMWAPVAGATSYVVYRYESDPSQNGFPVESRETTSTSEMFSNLNKPNQYFRVRSRYSCAMSGFSTPESIIVNCKLQITEESLDITYCIGPDCDLGNDSRYVEFNNVPGATGYRIAIDDGLFVSEFFVEDIPGSTRQRVFLPENPNSLATGEIQALNGCGLSNAIVFTDKPPSGGI